MVAVSAWKIHCPLYESDFLNSNLAVSPWAGHRDFAYDWLAFMRPHRIVELGTHYGCSLFAFAQADKDLRLSCEIFAIDTWEGDSDAGFYGEEVYTIVTKTIQERFPAAQIKLLRKKFTEALNDIEDESVSLLHIDGFHSYDAAKEDFETWRCKLAKNAVVFFHDVDPSSGYGSSKYWIEVRDQYPHLEFLEHSFGLGILFPKGGHWYQLAQKVGLGDWLHFYQYKSQAKLFERQIADQRNLLEERWAILKNMEVMIQERDSRISSQDEILDERWSVVENMESMIKERDEVISTQEKMLVDRWGIVENMEAMIKERDALIISHEKTLEERDKTVATMREELNKYSNDIPTLLNRAVRLLVKKFIGKKGANVT